MVERALRALERGDDVPEFGSDLPAGHVEYRWTQLRALYETHVNGLTSADAATLLHLKSSTVAGWRAAFSKHGDLRDLRLAVDLWRDFSATQARDVERRWRAARRERSPDAAKWQALTLIARDKATLSAAARQVGRKDDTLSAWAKAYLAETAPRPADEGAARDPDRAAGGRAGTRAGQDAAARTDAAAPNASPMVDAVSTLVQRKGLISPKELVRVLLAQRLTPAQATDLINGLLADGVLDLRKYNGTVFLGSGERAQRRRPRGTKGLAIVLAVATSLVLARPDAPVGQFPDPRAP